MQTLPATTAAPPRGAPPDGARRARALTGAVVLTAVVVTTGVLGLTVGAGEVTWAQAVHVVQGHITGSAPGGDTDLIVWQLRLPRTVLGLVAGAALGLAGAQMQTVTRNDLADPGLLGVTAGAALSVALATMVLGSTALWVQVVAAFVGAVLATTAVAVFAGGMRRTDRLTLVLAGSAATAVFTAVTSVIALVDAQTLQDVRYWTAGSLTGRPLGLLAAAATPLLLGLALSLGTARALRLLELDADAAAGLGVDVPRATLLVVTASTLLTASAVALAGPVAFVGLVAPHLARAVVGAGHRALPWLAALGGAGLLVGADVLGRVMAPPGEVQAGVVVALVGAPVLVVLVQRRRLVGR